MTDSPSDRKIARDSHYVPVATMRRWSTDGTNVWAYRILVSSRKVPSWVLRSIRGLAYRRDLYTSFAGGQELDDFEQWLSREFEQPGLEAVDKLISGSRLTPNDWRSMTQLVAAQDVRTPDTFIEWMARLQKQVPEALDRAVAKLDKLLHGGKNRPVVDEELEGNEFSKLVRMHVEPPTGPDSDQAQIHVSVAGGRQMWIATMRHVLTGVAEVVSRHRWGVATPASDAEWPLTDHPVLRLNYYGDGRYDFRGGWGKRGAEIMMPVSPKHLLYVKIGDKPDNRFTFSPEHTQLVQRLLVERAHRWVFGRQQTDWVEEARPRVVDREAFDAEEAAWKDWHKSQLQSQAAFNEDRP